MGEAGAAAKGELVVIGAGFSRTGTLSTRVALEHLLGGPCYHGFVPMAERPEHIPLWMEVFQSERLEPEMARSLLTGYRAGLDITIFNWYKELMEEHPSAKVLLTVRDPHQWFASMMNLRAVTSTLVLQQPYAMVLRMIGMGGSVDLGSVYLSKNSPGVLGRVNQAMEAAEEEAVALFKAHVEEVSRCIFHYCHDDSQVRAHVPPERLLVYDVREGWEPLCSFLHLPVPNFPFPHVNDSASLKKTFVLIRWLCWGFLLAVPVLLACLLPR